MYEKWPEGIRGGRAALSRFYALDEVIGRLQRVVVTPSMVVLSGRKPVGCPRHETKFPSPGRNSTTLENAKETDAFDAIGGTWGRDLGGTRGQSTRDPGTEHVLGSQQRPAGGNDDVSDALELPIGLI